MKKEVSQIRSLVKHTVEGKLEQLNRQIAKWEISGKQRFVGLIRILHGFIAINTEMFIGTLHQGLEGNKQFHRHHIMSQKVVFDREASQDIIFLAQFRVLWRNTRLQVPMPTRKNITNKIK